MAITQAMATSFKVDILDGIFDFSSGTSQVFKIALYTSAATLGCGLVLAYSVRLTKSQAQVTLRAEIH
jgi:ABC-type Fe3+ transport system permease subunit